MTTEDILEEIADEAGWNDRSKIKLLCSFIADVTGPEELEEFLRDRLDEENKVSS